MCRSPIQGEGTDRISQITDVRIGSHDAYDRITFEFEEDGTPTYQIEAVIPPLADTPSGMAVEVRGDSFLKLTLRATSRVDREDGTLAYDGPTEFLPDFPYLRELDEAADFEAVSTWYIGLSGSMCVRVNTLADPARLVIDLRPQD